MIGRDYADRHDVVRARTDRLRRHRDHGIEIAGGQGVGEIAEVIAEESLHQGNS
jgi:hypothetical protein